MIKLMLVCFIFCLLPYNIKGVTREQYMKMVSTLMADRLENSCIKEKFQQLTPEEIEGVKIRKLTPGKKVACFLECVFKTVGYMNADGEIIQEDVLNSVKSVVDETEMKNLQEFMNVCQKVNEITYSEEEVTNCEKSRKAFDCLTENAEKFGYNHRMQ